MAKQNNMYVIVGRISDTLTGKPAAGLRIEAWDLTRILTDFVSNAVTDQNGNFRIEFEQAYFLELFSDREPDLFFKIFMDTQLIASTEDSVLWNRQVGKTEIVIGLELPAITKQTAFNARGQILRADGLPLSGVIVQAFDKDLRHEQPLGERKLTNKAGQYDIPYTADEFRRAEKGSADLLIRVYEASDETEVVLGQSAVVFNSGPIETINLVIDRQKYPVPSELERLAAELLPLFVDENVDPADLNQDDIAFLVGETGIEQTWIEFFAAAVRLKRETRLPGEAFYGFARQGLPTDLNGLLKRPQSEQRRALESALRDNIIPIIAADEIDQILNELRALFVKNALDEPLEPGKSSRGALLATSLASSEQQHIFMDAFMRHSGPADTFWDSLQEHPDFGPGVVNDLRFTLGLGSLTKNHVPLVQALRHDGWVKSLNDLVKLDVADWIKLANPADKPSVGFAPDTPGETDEQKADSIVLMVEDAFPMAMIAHRIETNGLPGDGHESDLKDTLVQFFQINPTFDFANTNIDDYLKNKAELSDSAREAVASQLKSMQRIFKLTSRERDIRTLMDLGFNSAQSIVQKGRDAFRKTFAKTDDPATQKHADEIYDNAVHATAMALTLYTKYSKAFDSGDTAVTLLPSGKHKEIPNWANLFGAPDYCACEQCRSVYSPAAYLVDLLAFLNNPELNGGTFTALDVLTARPDDTGKLRRPDLLTLELSCENTNTEIPYIDLVNEILENAVSGQSNAYQTHGTAADLALIPEHTNEAVYETTLAAAVHPWNLPFMLGVERTRAYLEKLGVPLHKLMRVFQPNFRGMVNGTPTDEEITAEHLGLSTQESPLITTVAPPQPWWTLWGYKTDPGIPPSVSSLLHQSGLSFAEFREMLSTRYVNPGKSIKCFADDPLSCNIADYKLTHMTQKALHNIHKFVRLRHKLGWTVPELDQAAAALADIDGAFNAEFLKNLSNAQLLREQLKMRQAAVLSLFAPLDTYVYSDDKQTEIRSPYAELFQNPIIKKLGSSPDPFALNGGELRGADPQHTAYVSDNECRLVVKVALGINDTDLALLLSREFPPATDGTKYDKLTLANLSYLYRIVILARALGITLADFLTFRELLTGIKPFDPAQPQDRQQSLPFDVTRTDATLRFVEQVRKVQASGFSLTELDYLLRHHELPPQVIAPNDDQVTALIKQVEADAQQPGQSPTGTLASDPAVLGNLIKPALSKWLKLDRQLLEVLVEDTNTDTAILKSRAALTQPSPHPPLIDDLVSAIKDKNPDGTARSLVDRVNALCPLLVLLHKVALLISKFKLDSQELRYLSAHGSDFAGIDPIHLTNKEAFDLNALSISLTTSYKAASFNQWERLYDLITLRDGLPRSEVSLIDVFETTATGGVEAKLAELLGENVDTITSLIASLNLTDSDLVNEVWLIRLRACLALNQHTKVLVGQLARWAKTPPSIALAAEIRGTYKTVTSDAQWTVDAKSIEDTLREKQRTALTTYLVANWGLVDTNALFDHFLIDLETTACQTTTRIKQAISTVQLFTQRCLMNLEDGVLLRPEAASEWQWMKKYQVWVANRKVFLYPENRIEPDQRDDKTPFFKDLENELMQNDITQETVEKVVESYLEKLDQVARLQVCGMYHEHYDEKSSYPDERANVLHVFARTRGVPNIYFYRKWIATDIASAYWTPWEKVDVDIEGDHLIPIVYNRRLYLFWPIFTEKSELPFDEVLQKVLNFFQKYIAVYVETAQSFVKVGQGLALEITGVVYAATEVFKSLGRSFVDTTPLTQDAKNSFVAKLDGLVNTVKDSIPIPLHKLVDVGLDTDLDTKYTSFPQIIQDLKDVNDAYFEAYLELLGELVPRTRWDIQMAWAEFKNDKWSAKKISHQSLKFKDTPGSLFNKKRLFTFSSTVTDDTLEITCNVTYPKLPTAITDGIKATVQSLLPQEQTIFTQWAYDAAGQVENLIPMLGNPSLIGTFKLESCYGTLKAIPAPSDLLTEVFDFIKGLNKDMIDAFQAVQRFVEGEPVSLNDDDESAMRTNIIPAMLPRSLNQTQPLLPPFRVITPHQYDELLDQQRFPPFFFYQDTSRTFFVVQPQSFGFEFHTFYHPYVCEFIKLLNRDGVNGLLRSTLQVQDPVEFFTTEYGPVTSLVHDPYPVQDVDFSHSGAYSQYNWELFFHIPLLIADRLMKNRHFEEAQQWFHYIFDPTDRSQNPSPKKYWRTGPFFKTASEQYQQQQIDRLLGRLAGGDLDLVGQVEQWREDPFNPHLIARLRTTAYQKTVVMKYIDNLITWGDYLFQQDTVEEINEATQLYILAVQILGKRPEEIVTQTASKAKTYKDLQSIGLDAFSNALVAVENLVPMYGASAHDTTVNSLLGSRFTSGFDKGSTLARPKSPPSTKSISWISLAKGFKSLYFCVPKNDKLIGYWDKIAEQLFKIHHCQNIEGVTRVLLPEPTIDPALLVRATAAGLNIGDILNNTQVGVPRYRFSVLAQKATELCSEVKTLGGALLSALEKHDVEQLARLRSGHEIALLNQIKLVKQKQLDEAKHTLIGLERLQDTVKIRHDFYEKILFMTPAEVLQLALHGASLGLQAVEVIGFLAATTLHAIPNFKGGFVTTVGASEGGDNMGSAAQSFASALSTLASTLSSAGSMVGTVAGYERRRDEWQLQKDLAGSELKQIDQQILVGQIRVVIAQKELDNHLLQMANTQEVDTYMRDKFTNQEIYDWMSSQLSLVYFQTYQLAFDVAKQAEKAYGFELGIDLSVSSEVSFIQFGKWDNLNKGLLAGEWLYSDIKRMEVAYLDNNKRDYEITKHISLLLNDPIAFINLKETGYCEFELLESHFDADYLGHYRRRIKNVTLTIPCVTGPYTSINCTLTLKSDKTRIDDRVASDGSDYSENPLNSDARFHYNWVSQRSQSIVTSHAQNDSGMFELNFHDERYLPFEGAGVISKWSLDMPKLSNAFDFGTISDVVFKLSYTARASDTNDNALQGAAQTALIAARTQPPPSRLFSLKHEFSDAWYQFQQSTSNTPTIQFDLEPRRFPFQLPDKSIKIHIIDIFVKFKAGKVPTSPPGPLSVAVKPPDTALTTSVAETGTLQGYFNTIPELLHTQVPAQQGITWNYALGIWSLTITSTTGRITLGDLDDIVIVCQFTT